MSDVLYPVGLIRTVRRVPFVNLAQDIFEAGNTASKLIWPAQYFKHLLKLQHAPLKSDEYRTLLSFFSQRNGIYDYFWYRDNIDRTGNYKVRFMEPIDAEHYADYRNLAVALQEVAPRRMLPFIEELRTAAGGLTPFAWYDPNRRAFSEHMGVRTEESNFIDSANGLYPLSIAGTNALSLGSTWGAQYQSVICSASPANWMKSSGNVAELVGSNPACTLFIIASRASTAANEVQFAIGTEAGSGSVYGIGLTSANKWAFYRGNALYATPNSQITNSPASTPASICFTVGDGGATNVKGYNNGLLVGSADTPTFAYTAGKIALGASTDGSLKADTTALAQAIAFPGALTAAQVKALHNLFVPQQGLVTVP